MSSNLLNELCANLNHLSNAERKIASAILADPKRFITYSMTELSEIADVSHGSIINFSNKFSGGGFPNLKLQIAASISGYEQSFSVATGANGIKDVLEKTIQNNVNALKNTLSMSDEETLKKAADRILGAKKIEIFGIYRSAIVASNLHFQLLQLGIPASFVSDVLSNSISASMLDPDCLVIAISNSGKTKDIIDAVRVAKDRGVPIVGITSNKHSPLAKLSDETLIAASCGSTVSGSETEVQISQLIITDALCTYLRSCIDAGEKRYWAIKNILSSHNVED